MISVRFGLRGLKEQYELRRYPDSQINIAKIDSKDALVYREFQSKTRWGISYRVKNPARVSYSFCSGVRFELFRKYLFLGPRGLAISNFWGCICLWAVHNSHYNCPGLFPKASLAYFTILNQYSKILSMSEKHFKGKSLYSF